MAKAPTKQAPPADPPSEKKPKKKSRLPMMIMLLVTLGGGGAGAWYFLKSEAPAVAAGAAAAPVTAAPVQSEKPPVFHNLDQFTVNLQPENGDQFLQVALVIKVKDPATAEAIKARAPEIRNRILLLLSGKRASEISTVAGKETLSEEIMAEVKKPLSPESVQQQVVAVYYGAFVIQ